MSGIFLSYRRADATGWAGRLHDSLSRLLPGVTIFMDVEEIPPGVKFADYIRESVGSCDALIALIGPTWATVADSQGRPRLDDPEDYVRLEIASALERKDVRVIPTLVGGATMPDVHALPEPLKGLCARQNHEIADRAWDDNCHRLAEALKLIVAPAAKPAAVVAATPKRSVGLLAGLAAALVAAVGVSVWAPWHGKAAAPQPVVPTIAAASTPAPAAVPASLPASPTASATAAAAASALAPSTDPAPNAGAVELAFWDGIKNSQNEDDYQAYLDKYPNGQFASVAKLRAGSWVTTASGCKMEIPNPTPTTSVTWTGSCLAGKAEGTGTMELLRDGKKFSTVTGRFHRGNTVGVVSIAYADGLTYEGTLEHGRWAGHGITVGPAGRFEGTFKNGKRSGMGTLTRPDGTRQTGNYMDGTPDGSFVFVTSTGQRSEKIFNDGKWVTAR